MTTAVVVLITSAMRPPLPMSEPGVPGCAAEPIGRMRWVMNELSDLLRSGRAWGPLREAGSGKTLL